MTAEARIPAALARYWPSGAVAVAALPLPHSASLARASFPPRLHAVTLPEWASDVAVTGALLVPAEAVLEGEGAEWTRTDWPGAAEWYVTCAAERAFEAAHGPIHSYSSRLGQWDARMWERAWANRIALFLRRWAARHAHADETHLCGPLPAAEIVMTHDVDAIEKTLSLRIKQSGFHAYNAARKLAGGNVRGALRKSGAAARFFLRRGNLWNFDAITALEERKGIRSHFYFYGGRTPWRRPPRQLLLDPAYDVLDSRLRPQLRRLSEGGWTVGLHPSFDAWSDAAVIRRERENLERAAGSDIRAGRQHWLRFAFDRTWRAQQDAGLTSDATLGFNDRPGFRNGAALRWQPLAGGALESLPLVVMDSHLYDYRDLTDDERPEELAKWIGEIRAVRGVATVLWHQQVCSDDYGWMPGFVDLLEEVTR